MTIQNGPVNDADEVRSFIDDYLYNHRTTKKQLSLMLGCSPSYVSDVLNGNRNLTPKILSAFGFVAETYYRRTERKLP